MIDQTTPVHIVQTTLNMLLVFHLGSVNIFTRCDVCSRRLTRIFIAVSLRARTGAIPRLMKTF